MIIQTIATASQFRNAFEACGRGDQFSYDALNMLFEYFDDAGEQIDLDVISICCDFQESTADEVREQYDVDADVSLSDFLSDNTLLIGYTDSDTYVFASF